MKYSSILLALFLLAFVFVSDAQREHRHSQFQRHHARPVSQPTRFLNSLPGNGSTGQKLPNVGYLAFGYNIYYGDPLATDEFDPGFAQVPIFALTYLDNTTTPDGQWEVPDNTVFPGTAVECSVTGSTTLITSDVQFNYALSGNARGWGSKQGQGKNPGGAFSASGGFKLVHNKTRSGLFQFYSSTGECQAYEISLNSFIHPNVSDILTSKIQTLPTTFDINNATIFWQFFDLVGTHFVVDMLFGARWGDNFQVSSNDITTINSLGLDGNLAASYQGQEDAGVVLNGTFSTSLLKNFSQFINQTYSFSLGISPPANGNPQDWINAVTSSTAISPLQYTMLNLSFLFTGDWTTDPDFLARYDAVSQALDAYCPSYLIPTGALESCAQPPPPPPDPDVGYGALACDLSLGKLDCFSSFYFVWDGLSNTQAQEIALDSCKKCGIAASFDNGTCLSLAADHGSGKWAYATAPNVSASDEDAIAACRAEVKDRNQEKCGLVASACSSAPPEDALWGAIACEENCDKWAATPNGQGYSDRMAAHQAALGQLGKNAIVIVDFDQCGAFTKGAAGYYTARGGSPQMAMNSSLALCKYETFDCHAEKYSCVNPGPTYPKSRPFITSVSHQ